MSSKTIWTKCAPRRSGFLMSSAICGALAFVGPISAQAQDEGEAAGAKKRGVDEIIITTKRGRIGVQDIPVSITAFDDSRLERLDALDFEDVITQVPGTNFISNGGPGRGNEVASIRGLSPVADNTVSVVAQYLDGAPRFGENYRLFDLGEVAVYRGPQGTLWGAQAIGGLISFRSNRPDPSEFTALAQADVYTSDDDGGVSYRLAGHVNIPLIEGKAALRVAAQYIDESGYIDNVTTGADNVNQVDEFGWRVSGYLAPTDWLDLTLIYHGNDLSSDAPSFFDIDLGGFRIAEPFTKAPANQRYDLINFIAEADLGWGALSYTGSYFDLERDVVDFDENVFGFIPLGRVDTIDEQMSWTHELRLVSTYESRLNWVVGLYYDDLETLDPETTIEIDASGAPTTMPPFEISVIGGPEDFREIAVFGEATLDVTDWLSVLAGGRYFDWEVDNREEFTFFGGNFQQETGKVGGDDFFWKVQLNLQPTEDHLIYVTRSEGFRFGGFNPFVGPALNIPEEFIQFDPDALVNYEIGTRTNWLDDRLLINAALYYMDWDEIQTVVFNEPGTFAFTTNGPKLKAHGGELEVVVQDIFVPGFFMAASYAYTKNEFKEDAIIFPGRALIESGEELRRTPRQTWSLDIGYDFTVGDGIDAFVRANYWHRDRTSTEGFNSQDGAVPIAAQDVINMSAGLSYEGWRLKVYVDNVGNERPFQQVFSAAPSGSPGGETPARASSVRPRTFGLEITKSFGL